MCLLALGRRIQEAVKGARRRKTRPDTRLLKLRADEQVALFEITRLCEQEQWGQKNKIVKKSKM